MKDSEKGDSGASTSTEEGIPKKQQAMPKRRGPGDQKAEETSRGTEVGGLCLPEAVEETHQGVPPALAGLGSVRQAEAGDCGRKLERHLRESTRGDYA